MGLHGKVNKAIIAVKIVYQDICDIIRGFESRAEKASQDRQTEVYHTQFFQGFWLSAQMSGKLCNCNCLLLLNPKTVLRYPMAILTIESASNMTLVPSSDISGSCFRFQKKLPMKPPHYLKFFREIIRSIRNIICYSDYGFTVPPKSTLLHKVSHHFKEAVQ